MATETTESSPRKIRKEGWLETQDQQNKTVWTRDWVVVTPNAIHIYENYKCYKDAKKIIHGTDILSILDPGNVLCIKTNKESIYFRCIGYQEQGSWKYQIEQCLTCINIPISVLCNKEKRYNSNFVLSIPYNSYPLDEIVKDIIFHLENKYNSKNIHFIPNTIQSSSYCDKTIDCTDSKWNDWKYRDNYTPNKFPKETVIKNGVCLNIDISDKKQVKQPKKTDIKTEKKMDEKEAKKREWLMENEHNEIFWDKLRSMHRSERRKLKQLYVKYLLNPYQQKYIKENESRIQELLQRVKSVKEPAMYLTDKLLKILNGCRLIKENRIHEEILKIIVRFDIGNGLMPIYYTLSCLPFFDATIHGKADEYYDVLKVWWNEVRLSPNYCGVFQPANIENVATEFAQFLIKQLIKSGPSLKYYLVPCVKMDKSFNIWGEKDLGFQLGNKYSKCLGGIELFQRIYLEATVEDLFGIGSSFVVDLQGIRETHGDNWCFDGNGHVSMANNSYKQICDLKVGDKVRSFPNFVSTITCCIQSNVNAQIEMVKLKNNCWITFEHPVLIKNGNYNGSYDTLHRLDTDEIKKYGLLWVLPKQISAVQLRYQDKIYNFMLDSYHTINVNGNWCCTLGHDYKGETIYHPFWGSSTVVKSFLQSKSDTFPYVVC